MITFLTAASILCITLVQSCSKFTVQLYNNLWILFQGSGFERFVFHPQPPTLVYVDESVTLTGKFTDCTDSDMYNSVALVNSTDGIVDSVPNPDCNNVSLTFTATIIVINNTELMVRGLVTSEYSRCSRLFEIYVQGI